MKYKDKKMRIFRKFKHNTKEEIIERLNFLGFDSHCEEYSPKKVRLHGKILIDTYLTPLNELDKRIFMSWSKNYRYIPFLVFKNKVQKQGYDLDSYIKKIDIKKSHSLDNLRIYTKIHKNSNKEIYSAWYRNYKDEAIDFTEFEKTVISLGYHSNSEIWKIAKEEPYSLKNILIHNKLNINNDLDKKIYKRWIRDFSCENFDVFKNYIISKGYHIDCEIRKIDVNKKGFKENIRIYDPSIIENKIDKRLYASWLRYYSDSTPFLAFRDFCLTNNYTEESTVRRININDEYSLDNIEIYNPIITNGVIDEKIHRAWIRNYHHIRFEVFKNHCFSLGYETNRRIYKIDTLKPYSLDNLMIPSNKDKKDKTKYSLLLKNYKLIHSNIDFKELKEIAIKSDSYDKLDYPFITKHFRIIPLEESDLTPTQQEQIKRETKITQNVDMMMFEYQIRFKIKDINTLREYIEFCVNNHQEKSTEYIEGHHILMRSLFREYMCFIENPWNKVNLNKKDHIEAHRLLHIALNMRATMDAHNITLSCSNENQDYLGKTVIVFDYLGNEIERFRTKALAKLKFGNLVMLVKKDLMYFDYTDPKIAIFEDEFSKEKLKYHTDYLKNKIAHILDLLTDEVEEFSCLSKLKEKYKEFNSMGQIIISNHFVVYRPYKNEFFRVEVAKERMLSLGVYVVNNLNEEREYFFTQKLAKKKYPKFDIYQKTFDEGKYRGERRIKQNT